MAIVWQPYSALNVTSPAKLLPWLLDAGSFMQRLRRHGVADAKVQVLEQTWQLPLRSEQMLLGLLPRQYALVREVLISSAKGMWMFARTVFPRATITGREQLFARLKSRALGTMLFNNNASRGPFEFCLLKQDELWHKKIMQAAELDSSPCWARRSVFLVNHKKILLSEFFLPDLMEL